MPHPTKEAWAQTPRPELPHKAVQQGRATLIGTQPNIPNLRRDSFDQSSYKKIKASPPQPEVKETVQNIH
jgi:hypothetical protein